MSACNQLRHLTIKKREEERGNVRPVYVGIRHDDHALVAQIFVAIPYASPAAQRLYQARQFRILLKLAGCCACNVENFSTQRQDRLRGPVARLLGGPPRGISFNKKNLGASGGVARAVGKLARKTKFARCRLARD